MEYMNVPKNFSYDANSYTWAASFSTVPTNVSSLATYTPTRFVCEDRTIADYQNTGKYSVFLVADWFLQKADMTHKKLQKLCYYAQAWCYALKNYRLLDSDFQAWIHGPVSPALWEKFKQFGYSTISIKNKYNIVISEEDEELLEDVWETYGNRTGNALEALSHREVPWIEARRGYAENEKCTVVISPESMKDYYRSIYCGD